MQVDFENTAGCSQREDQWGKKKKLVESGQRDVARKNDEILKTSSGTAVLIDLLYINNHNLPSPLIHVNYINIIHITLILLVLVRSNSLGK